MFFYACACSRAQKSADTISNWNDSSGAHNSNGVDDNAGAGTNANAVTVAEPES